MSFWTLCTGPSASMLMRAEHFKPGSVLEHYLLEHCDILLLLLINFGWLVSHLWSVSSFQKKSPMNHCSHSLYDLLCWDKRCVWHQQRTLQISSCCECYYDLEPLTSTWVIREHVSSEAPGPIPASRKDCTQRHDDLSSTNNAADRTAPYHSSVNDFHVCQWGSE